MFDTWSSETLWVNVMNVVFALVCLVALAAVAFTLGRDLFTKVRDRRKGPVSEPGVYLLHPVGRTMADGGEPMEKAGEREHGSLP